MGKRLKEGDSAINDVCFHNVSVNLNVDDEALFLLHLPIKKVLLVARAS